MKYFIPILFLEVYLIITLLIFEFGPVSYHVELPFLFWGFMFIYLCSFLMGYIVAFITRSRSNRIVDGYFKNTQPSFNRFKLIMVAALASSLLGFKGVDSIFDLLNPIFLFDSALSGIYSPGEAYNIKMERVNSQGQGNILLSSVLFILAFSKVLIIPALVFMWDRLGRFSKFFAIFITLIPLLNGLSVGTNKSIFDFAIFYSSSLAVYFIHHYYRYGSFGFYKRKFFVFVFVFSFIGAFSFFGSAMSERGGNISYIETVSTLGEVTVNDSNGANDNFAYTTYVWLTTYVVQGYYGFSLSLTQDFTSTLGVGNSSFLTRQFERITGENLSDLTYQHKIDAWWGETSQWHSFYSHFANDVHFIGVAFICLILGFYLARLWISIIDNSNFYAMLLMPLFVLMIVFIPANNQVFGFLETFSAFFMASIFWFHSVYIKSYR